MSDTVYQVLNKLTLLKLISIAKNNPDININSIKKEGRNRFLVSITGNAKRMLSLIDAAYTVSDMPGLLSYDQKKYLSSKGVYWKGLNRKAVEVFLKYMN